MRFTASAVVLTLSLLCTAQAHAGSAMAKLSSVVDGNTLRVTLRGKEIQVRMHGIVVPPADATRPILQLLNTESVAFLKKYLADGWVYLEFPEGSAKVDKDGYVPAFVYRSTDATFLNEINPGNSAKGRLIYDVPKSVKLTKMELHDSPFSGGVEVSLS